MLQDIGQAIPGENFFPEVGSFVAEFIRWITLSVIISLIKRQKIGFIVGELGGHIDFIGIDGKMHQAATEIEQRLPGIPVFLILLDTLHAGSLTGPGVFELQRGDGQAVDKDHHIDLFPRIVQIVAHLASGTEFVAGEVLLYRWATAGQRQLVKQGKMRIFHFQAFA